MRGTYDDRPQAPKGARLAFGIFMILFYIGVGILFFLNIFQIDSAAIRIIIGVLLCAYGVFRGYRLYKGMN